jgi:adenylosuccinate lyase
MSRWQRDISDSTVLRNIGVACGHMLLALKSLQKGLHKIAVDKTQIDEDLNKNWEVLSEAIQTVMRRYSLEQPYEKLKELSRGKKITKDILQQFIETLDLPKEVKVRLQSLTPATYIGLAQELAQA